MNKVAVVVNQFPQYGQTFVRKHLRVLCEGGLDVLLMAEKIDNSALKALAVGTSGSIQGIQLASQVEEFRANSSARRKLFRKHFGFFYRTKTSGMDRWEKIFSALLSEAFEEHKPDTVYCHFGPNGLAAAHGARKLVIPLIVDFHGFDLTRYPNKRGWTGYSTHLQHAQAVVHSDFMAELLTTNTGLSPRKIRFGVDGIMFSSPERGDWPSDIKLLMVGRMDYQKGHSVAIEAMNHLPDNFSLNAIGDGEQMEFCRELVAKHGLQARVKLTGKVTHQEVASAMENADILLVPSRTAPDGWKEAFCLVALEGACCGLPVVASKHGGLPETSGNPELLVPENDPVALAAGIELAVNSSTPAEYRSKALEHVKAFSESSMKRDYIDILKKAVDG